ncbi:MAG: low molecular weight phosphotyrosine protein phosphatase [Gammaproteobacteria bacterium]|jgi:protein-tyrosine phosphatase|nr:low molecular weight phosphotyrosine protein phosphatase [Gammaproteobacteria bacterium]NCF81845.1 low molecular weight phosphotyrosine protein phosphatase [Pseudomonadota bacterium]
MIRVLFVCMGNICRSPMAQGVLEQRLNEERLEDRVQVDSAGTHHYHSGDPPDRRGVAAARQRGVEIGGQRARPVRDTDFQEFDLILAMDSDNEQALRAICPPFYSDRIKPVMDFAPDLREREVPDPYYVGGDGFEKVLDMLELCMEELMDELHDRLGGRDTIA